MTRAPDAPPTIGSRRRARTVVGAAVLTVVVAGLAGCGGGGGGSSSASTTAPAAPAGCKEAPTSIQLGIGEGAKAEPFEVADAAAQRVAILPGKMAFDASEMAGLSSQAAVSPLGQYTVYLSDGEIDAAQLEGDDEGTIADGSATVAVVRIDPAAEGGFVEGEVVSPDGKLQYETRSEQAPVRAAIVPDGAEGPMDLTGDVTGTVTVLQVDDDDICVDVDLTVADAQGGRIDGVVQAPVHRAGNAFFVT